MRLRMVFTFAIAMAVHMPFLVPRHPAPEVDTSTIERAERRTRARAEHSRLLGVAEAEVMAGRATFGDTLVRLGFYERAMDEDVESEALDRALGTYRALLVEVRASDAPVQRAILDAALRDGRVARYKRMHVRLFDALAYGGGNCVALSSLAIALAFDRGARDGLSLRVYSNHAAPEVGGFHFGMTAKCHGPGIAVDPRALLRQSPFVSPKSKDACDDPGDLFGSLQLKSSDAPSTPASKPEAECRRRNVMEQYDGDVEVLDAQGHSLGGVAVAHPEALDLEGRSQSAACFERKLAELPADVDAETLALTLGDLALADLEAARVFALANEHDVAREYDRRLAFHRARAAIPLELLRKRLDDDHVNATTLVANAGRLVALGEPGLEVMRVASEKHRGFWELASLMTQVGSQDNAIARWRNKPVDVQLDVVDALPCNSHVFLDRQTDPDLRHACEARMRAETAPCSTTIHAKTDLAEAVFVRRLSVRCKRDEAFVTSAKKWAAHKSEPIALAATRRL